MPERIPQGETLSKEMTPEQKTAPEAKLERQPLSERILNTIDIMVQAHLKFEHKDNEGQQALIFRMDINADIDALDGEERRAVEDYLESAKSIKVLKITNRELAEREFEWQFKAYALYEGLPEEDKANYAGIPKPYTFRTVEINDEIEERLNRQNAKIESGKASVMLMEWVDGEDLLTILFRKYLAGRPGYADKANDPNVNFSSLHLSVIHDFQSRGLSFPDMETLEQYKRLLQAVNKNGQSLVNEHQKKQIQNTLDLLHKNGIYHNDLHLRNYMIEKGSGKPYLIDFCRSDSKEQPNPYDVKDDFLLNYLNEFKTDQAKTIESQKSLALDLARIEKFDRGYAAMLASVKKLRGAELVKVLQQESSQWRVDTWGLKRMVAVARKLAETDAAKAEFIKEFLRDKKKSLQLEAQQVIDAME